ncbi:MAG: GNAT family N-acetyltransferase [Thermoguttaceae bacterium]|nr:GNAT family N-acetyltransferase [Thermoguttaceae bacterium]
MPGLEIRSYKRYRMERDLTEPLPVEPAMPQGYALIPWYNELLRRHAEVKYLSFCNTIDAEVLPLLSTQEGCLKVMRAIVERRNFLPSTTWLMVYTGGYAQAIDAVFSENAREREAKISNDPWMTEADYRGAWETVGVPVHVQTFQTSGHRTYVPISPYETYCGAAFRHYRTAADASETGVGGNRVVYACGTIQGLYDPVSTLGAIQNVGVLPQYRRQGLATLLLWYALRAFRELGLSRAFLEVTAINTPAIQLYQQLGFQIACEVSKTVEIPRGIRR